jgi:hypothetical protein
MHLFPSGLLEGKWIYWGCGRCLFGGIRGIYILDALPLDARNVDGSITCAKLFTKRDLLVVGRAICAKVCISISTKFARGGDSRVMFKVFE